MTEKLVMENERVDDLQNGYYVIQDPVKFRSRKKKAKNTDKETRDIE